jgi:signal transduction histidine kinase
VSGLSGIVDAMRSQGVNVDVEVPDFDLSPREQDVLLRTASEALRNVALHSLCTSVVVRLLRENDHLLLVIRDDGQGFSPAVAMSQRRAGHLGLQLISDLASEVGGVLSVESEVGHGTEVRLELFDRVREHA